MPPHHTRSNGVFFLNPLMRVHAIVLFTQFLPRPSEIRQKLTFACEPVAPRLDRPTTRQAAQ